MVPNVCAADPSWSAESLQGVYSTSWLWDEDSSTASHGQCLRVDNGTGHLELASCGLWNLLFEG